MDTATQGQSIVQILSQKIEKDQVEVPMLPEVANKVMRLTQDPDSEAGDLARLISSDQTLAGHVMRIANSALYSPNNTLVSLQQAITRLGMSIIANIALAASINSKMFNAPGYREHIQQELEFSLMAALWSKEIARSCRKNVETAFLAGLLHDIGRPVCIQTVLEVASSANIDLTPEMVFLLESKFHRPLSMSVVHQWELPSSVSDVVTWFDDYANAGKALEPTMIVVAGAAFASHFYDKSEAREQITREQLLGKPVLSELNLYPEDIEELLKKEDVVKSAMEAMKA